MKVPTVHKMTDYVAAILAEGVVWMRLEDHKTGFTSGDFDTSMSLATWLHETPSDPLVDPDKTCPEIVALLEDFTN